MKIIAAILVPVLLATSALGETRLTPEQKIAGQIREISSHKDPRVTLVMRTGDKVKGRLGEVGESSFTLISTADNTSHTYSYAEVASVHAKGMSTGAKIGIGVVAGLAGLLVAGLLVFRSMGPM